MTDRIAREQLAVLVHEVRSPTAALLAIAHAFEEPELDEGARAELVRLAIGACEAIERIVLDVSYASIDAQEVDLVRLIRDLVATATLDGARIEARVEPDLPRISGDPLRLRQALGNLVANARIHSETSDPVVVGASAADGEVRLFVSDSGLGVHAADRERILEAGVRLDPARPGSGLGLAIARAIAEAHGGRLTVESARGHGSTFALVLPAGYR